MKRSREEGNTKPMKKVALEVTDHTLQAVIDKFDEEDFVKGTNTILF